MDAFAERHEGVEEVDRDGHSTLIRAVDREEGVPVLVRRAVRSRRFDVDVRAGLVAEAEYCARLACSRCPEAEVFTLEDGELLLEYKGADGVELDRVFSALQASGRVLTPAAAVALVSEVLHNAEAIARIKPPAVETEIWGHGEITPRSVLLGRDGFGRLFEVRLATTGFRSQLAQTSALCRAPELTGGVLFGTPSSDVYAVGALVALALFGAAPLAAAAAEPLGQVVARAAAASPGLVPDPLLSVLLLALEVVPSARYAGPESLREALRTAMPLDLAGWRATAEGLAALARTLGADRKATQVPEALFTAHPGLARVVGARGTDIDADIAAFAQDHMLSSSQVMAAMAPVTDPLATPRRGTALPRRIAVVPRRVSRAVADAFDAPRASPVPGTGPPSSPRIEVPAELRRSSSGPPSSPRIEVPAELRRSSSGPPSSPRIEVPAELRGSAELRRSPVPSGDLMLAPRLAVPAGIEAWPPPISSVSPALAPAALSPLPEVLRPTPSAPPMPPLAAEGSETFMVDEQEAARALEQRAPPTLEIIPSEPPASRPQLLVIPSEPAPTAPHHDRVDEEAGGARMMWMFVVGVMFALVMLVVLTLR